jgi:hypothetical protein
MVRFDRPEVINAGSFELMRDFLQRESWPPQRYEITRVEFLSGARDVAGASRSSTRMGRSSFSPIRRPDSPALVPDRPSCESRTSPARIPDSAACVPAVPSGRLRIVGVRPRGVDE